MNATKTYLCLGFSGRVYDNRGTGYTTRQGARQACERAGDVPVETRGVADRLPQANDADGWDRVRMADGCPAR